MKKTVFILAAMMAVAMSANAQWFDFRNNVHRYEIGINLGVAGLGTQCHDFGFGASLSAWGVYLDIVTAGPKYKYDNHVNAGPTAMVPDSTATSISLGYQIPVLPWLRIMPIVGHTHVTSGYTDFSTVNIEVNETSGQMTPLLAFRRRIGHLACQVGEHLWRLYHARRLWGLELQPRRPYGRGLSFACEEAASGVDVLSA